MRFIQHKAEARWFYRVVSLGYDRWINPLFWTAPMRDRALALARLDDPGLEVVDVGAGTGFATEAIVRTVAPDRVTMLDQSPHQLARARRKRALAGVSKVLGDAEALPFATDSRDRYVSTGSIEYWPDPQRAIAEAYRVLRPGGIALLAGPLRRTHPLARALSDAWMLFPSRGRVRGLVRARGLRGDRARARRARLVGRALGPLWLGDRAVKPRAGEPPLAWRRRPPPRRTARAYARTPGALRRRLARRRRVHPGRAVVHARAQAAPLRDRSTIGERGLDAHRTSPSLVDEDAGVDVTQALEVRAQRVGLLTAELEQERAAAVQEAGARRPRRGAGSRCRRARRRRTAATRRPGCRAAAAAGRPWGRTCTTPTTTSDDPLQRAGQRGRTRSP